MKLSELTTQQFEKLELECPCGATHRVSTSRYCLGRNAISRLAGIVEELGAQTVLAVTAKDVEPLFAATEADLRKRVRLTVHRFAAEFVPSMLTVSVLTRYRADAVIAFGSGSVTDAAKYYCSVTGVPLISVLTAPVADLSDTSNLLCGGKPEKFAAVSPAAVIADFGLLDTAPAEHAASALGWMAASALSLFEWKLSALLTGGSYCQTVADFLWELAEEAVRAGERYANGNREAITDLASCLIRQGACDQMLGHSRGTEGSATLTAAVLKLVGEPSGRGHLLGERALIAANRLIRLFEETLLVEHRLPVLPSDKVRRAGLMAAYCGGDADAILKRLYRMPKLNLALADYLLRENRCEIEEELLRVRMLLTRANRVFKRMYRDGGYWLAGLAIPQFRTAVYLAPDLTEGFTVLGLLRDTGVLETVAEAG